jgi:hypothetical protein
MAVHVVFCWGYQTRVRRQQEDAAAREWYRQALGVDEVCSDMHARCAVLCYAVFAV